MIKITPIDKNPRYERVKSQGLQVDQRQNEVQSSLTINNARILKKALLIVRAVAYREKERYSIENFYLDPKNPNNQ